MATVYKKGIYIMNLEVSSTTYTIYFAGALFDHKDLTGNAILVSYINELSCGKYLCILPQDLAQATNRANDIRDQDLRYVLECDLAIFNFDGAELDSGTVVEFIYAKSLDIPCVVIRSDFRQGGEQARGGDRWNLMASFYPRTRKLEFNAMEWYQKELTSLSGEKDVFETADRFYKKIATALINELDAVIDEAPLLSTDKGQASSVYEWALSFPGSGVRKSELNLNDIIKSKREKGLIG